MTDDKEKTKKTILEGTDKDILLTTVSKMYLSQEQIPKDEKFSCPLCGLYVVAASVIEDFNLGMTRKTCMECSQVIRSKNKMYLEENQ